MLVAQSPEAAPQPSISPAPEPVAIIVQDMERSRHFYAEILGQKVKTSTSTYTTFEKGFSLWQTDRASSVIGQKLASVADGGFEMVFVSEQMDAVMAQLERAQVKLVHPVREQPWGQRVVRFYDPDGHMLEVGEPMDAVVRRLLKQGMSAEDVSRKTAMPLELVKEIGTKP